MPGKPHPKAPSPSHGNPKPNAPGNPQPPNPRPQPRPPNPRPGNQAKAGAATSEAATILTANTLNTLAVFITPPPISLSVEELKTLPVPKAESHRFKALLRIIISKRHCFLNNKYIVLNLSLKGIIGLIT
jgi:hypothetical protein